MTFDPEATAVETLKCCLAWEPDVLVLGSECDGSTPRVGEDGG